MILDIFIFLFYRNSKVAYMVITDVVEYLNKKDLDDCIKYLTALKYVKDFKKNEN